MAVNSFSAEIKASDGDSGTGSFTAVASRPVIDRDNEIVDAYCFAPLPLSIPLLVNHSWKTDGVGRATPSYNADGDLLVTGVFAPTQKGQELRRLVADGFIDSTSVGFLSPQYENDSNGRRQ